MAYSTSNPPRLLVQNVGSDDGGNIWVYVSADAQAVVRAADYFTDALDLGMKVNDVVLVVDTTTPAIFISAVISVDADGADLSDGTAVVMTNT